MTQKENRLFFLDNLRTFIIFLVVVYHAGWVYEESRILSDYWIVDDPARNGVAGIFNLIVDMFMMPTMFFISGYFSPLSLQSKNGWSFLMSRFKRIVVPWILAVIILIPLYKVIFLFSRNLPQENFVSYFHFTGGVATNQGWLWFLPVLFLFDILYFLLAKLNMVPVKVNLKIAIPAVFLIGFAYSFFISMAGYSGWTKTILLDFQNERLLIYFLFFLMGSLSYHQSIFDTLPKSKMPYYALCAIIWIPLNMYIVFLINMFLNPGKFIFSEAIDKAICWSGFQLSILGMLYILVNTFRFYLNKKGRLMNHLNDYSYGVYIVHLIVIGVIASILLNMSIPSLAKYGILAITGFIISNFVVFVYRKGMQKI